MDRKDAQAREIEHRLGLRKKPPAPSVRSRKLVSVDSIELEAAS